MIPYRQYKDQLYRIPTMGDQIKVNHEGCTAGTDTRERLYIKRVGHTAVVCHCFNCGDSGYYFGGSTARAEDLLGYRGGSVDGSKLRTPAVLEPYYKSCAEEFPPHVAKYLLDYQITPDEAAGPLAYRYDQANDALVMPVFQDVKNALEPTWTVGHTIRMQRRFMGENKKIRYDTLGSSHYYSNGPFFGLVSDGSYSKGGSIILVEDQISAYRVFRDSGGRVDSMALLGTNLSSGATECLVARKPASVKVWLDADIAGVRATNSIVETLRPVLDTKGAVIHPIFGYEQPKSQSVTKLNQIINDWVK